MRRMREHADPGALVRARGTAVRTDPGAWNTVVRTAHSTALRTLGGLITAPHPLSTPTAWPAPPSGPIRLAPLLG
ncbi:hypothetical protein GCM10010442_14310 [Kitasatospora kifunensis]